MDITIDRWRLQERQCYYGLSAAGAAIGYALATIENEITLIETRLLLGAIFSWIASMGMGLWVILLLDSLHNISISALRFRAKSTNELEAADRIYTEKNVEVGRKMYRARFSQTAFLLLGALIYLFCRVDVLAALGISLAGNGIVS